VLLQFEVDEPYQRTPQNTYVKCDQDRCAIWAWDLIALLMNFLDTPEKRDRRLVHLPMGRFGEAVEIAKAALFCEWWILSSYS
jgi:hypothetical protein